MEADGNRDNEYNSYMNEYMKSRYHAVMESLRDYLGGQCSVCGVTEDLEFDHVDPSVKAFTISSRAHTAPIDVLIDELSKCQLLCSEHHRQKTSAEKSVDHGSGASGKKNCKCEPCRDKKNEYMRNWKKQRMATSNKRA